MTDRITIVLVEDHRIVREGLRLLLEEDERFAVVGECADGLAACDTVRHHAPQIAIVDLGLPGIGGLEVTARITRDIPATRVVILSMHANIVHVREAFRRGAFAYVLKDAGGEQLIRAICETAAGRQYVSPPLTLDALHSADKPAAPAQTPPGPLTQRERQVASLVAEGLSAKEIAAHLSISPRTVELHRSNAIRKLGLRNLADLVRVMHDPSEPGN